ncbi:hypothetical protein G7067_05225 [Leucobacter insecticola]|uniref:Uncharacterized protein n=1 Tax=Leucobacter insecticola TaxID=2714934 RepID=A0A6G8FHW2_9MICO|nr:hypothetical protein [Leucobacter insecticola]QIM15955.1 hypothetical protein G7067_05225 [Leucobacter insecticola]
MKTYLLEDARLLIGEQFKESFEAALRDTEAEGNEVYAVMLTETGAPIQYSVRAKL